jgi:hypothetical protein
LTDTTVRSKTIDLFSAIDNKGHKYTQITLRPPRTGERRQAEMHLSRGQTPTDFTKFGVTLVSKCCGVDEAVIEQMDDDQFMEAWEWVGSFFGGGQKASNA